MGKLEHRGEVRVRRYSGYPECDVVVSFRGREMIIRLPDYRQAIKWAQMEAKTYKVPGELLEEQVS